MYVCFGIHVVTISRKKFLCPGHMQFLHIYHVLSLGTRTLFWCAIFVSLRQTPIWLLFSMNGCIVVEWFSQNHSDSELNNGYDDYTLTFIDSILSCHSKTLFPCSAHLVFLTCGQNFLILIPHMLLLMLLCGPKLLFAGHLVTSQ
jgi:hypothetical protein